MWNCRHLPGSGIGARKGGRSAAPAAASRCLGRPWWLGSLLVTMRIPLPLLLLPGAGAVLLLLLPLRCHCCVVVVVVVVPLLQQLLFLQLLRPRGIVIVAVTASDLIRVGLIMSYCSCHVSLGRVVMKQRIRTVHFISCSVWCTTYPES